MIMNNEYLLRGKYIDDKSQNHRKQGLFICLANTLLMLYTISIYIWSSNATMYLYSNLICLLAIAIMLLVVLANKQIEITISLAYLLAFEGFCITSILWAEDPSRSIVKAFNTLPLLIIFAIVLFNYLSFLPDGKKYLLKCIYVSGIVLSVYTIWIQGGIGAYLGQLGTGVRLGGEVANENIVGMGGAFSFIIAFYHIVYEHKPINLIAMFLCGLVAFGAGSNKALIAMAVGCVLLLLFYAHVKKTVLSLFKVGILLLIVAIAFVMLMQLPMFSTINKRFTEMINTFQGSGAVSASTLERLALTKAGLQQFMKTPFLGIGIGNSGLITKRVSVGFDSYLHNNYVELLACVGIIGTTLFYLAVLTPLFHVLNKINSKSYDAVLAAVLILAWLFIQVGFVSYADKTSYIYIVLIGLYALPTFNNAENSDTTGETANE